MLYLFLFIPFPQKPKFKTDANNATITCLQSEKTVLSSASDYSHALLTLTSGAFSMR